MDERDRLTTRIDEALERFGSRDLVSGSEVLDEDGVCVRAGHHCAKPLMRVLGVPATTRASFYVYNDEADADALVDSLVTAEKFFAI